jgi:hypothetical protein
MEYYGNYEETFKGQTGIINVCFDVKCLVVAMQWSSGAMVAQQWFGDGLVLVLWWWFSDNPTVVWWWKNEKFKLEKGFTVLKK